MDKCSRIVQSSTPCQEEIIPLDSSSAGMMYSIEFALLFAKKADVEALASSMEVVLASFAPAAGRMALRDGQPVIVCNNAGIPFSWSTMSCCAPSFASVLHSSLFDCICEFEPHGVNPARGALMQVKVTDFDDAQVIAFSICHALADARSIADLITAWSTAFQGLPTNKTFNHNRTIVFSEATVSPVVLGETLPQEWSALNKIGDVTFNFALGLSPPAMVGLSWCRSLEECEQLKERQGLTFGGIPLTTNDVLSAEVLLAHQFQGKSVKLGIVMECRAALDALDLFGNALVMLNLDVQNSEQAAVDIRNVLPVARSTDFVKWKWKQPTNNHPVQLCVTSWVQAFKLSDLCFADAADDVMIGMPMMTSLARQMEPVGQRSCWLLPQKTHGVKIVTAMPNRTCDAFLAKSGNADASSVSCTDLVT